MVIITARSLTAHCTGCDTGLVKVRVSLYPPCPHLTTSSLSPSGATIITWRLTILISWDSMMVYLYRDLHVPCQAWLWMTQYSPLATLHSLAALCRSQLVLAGLSTQHWHWVDSSLTRECLPLTIFRTGAGVNQSGPEYSGPSNRSTEAWADSQLEIVTAWQQPDEQFRFERNFPYS